MSYLLDPDPRDQVMSIMFVILTLGGGVFLIVCQLMGLDFDQPIWRNLPGMYGIVWLAYSLWIVDLVAGLPFGVTRFEAVPGLLCFSIFCFLLREIAAWQKDRTRVPAEGYRFCPKCRAVIVQISVECPECHHKLNV